MSFKEKLVILRKEKLLSQEELAEKLNIPREIVSKWETGEVTPDLEKLLEISRILGVSLDELTDQKVKENTDPIKENNNSVKKIIIVLLILAIFFGIVFLMFNSFFKFKDKLFNSAFDKIKDATTQTQTEEDSIYKQINEIQTQVLEQVNSINDQTIEIVNEREKDSFNNTFKDKAGTKSGTAVQWVIDDIIKNNQTNERKIKVIYNETEAVEPSELRSMKRNFDETFEKYELYFEYDENGYIYEAIIEKI